MVRSGQAVKWQISVSHTHMLMLIIKLNCLSFYGLLHAERMPAVAVMACSRGGSPVINRKHLCHCAYTAVCA